MHKGALAFVLLATIFMSGCVAHIPFAQQLPPIDHSGLGMLAVSVVDDRERVKKGKPRNFVGVAHGIFGIPSDLNIKSALAVEDGDKARDLAQYLQYRIMQGFKARGWNAVELDLKTVPGDEQTRALLAGVGANQLLLLQLREWFFRLNLSWATAFNFDTDRTVFIYGAHTGKVLEKKFAGRDVVDQEWTESPQNHILMAYRDQLAEILNDPEVKQALALGSVGPQARR
jgi:hypothetical protein